MLVPSSHEEKVFKDNTSLKTHSPQPIHSQRNQSDVLVLSLPYVHMGRTMHLNISALVLLPLSASTKDRSDEEDEIDTSVLEYWRSNGNIDNR